MKPFDSFLANQLNEYLDYRQGLGYSIEVSRKHLMVFDQYLRRSNADWEALTSFFFLDMRAHLDMETRSINRVFSSLRVFFHFLLRHDYVRDNPLRDIPPLKENRIIPFVFSPDQTEQLLRAACKRVQHSKRETFLKDLAIYLAMVLLARCGMRISEPLNLMNHHYRLEEATLYIEKTKFKKQRLIPLPQSAVQALENYLSVRRSLEPHDQNPYLLAGKNLGPLHAGQIRYVFLSAVKEIGLDQGRRVIGNVNFSRPSPHSLRHSFAVNTLIKIKERGDSPQHALPVLAAYMGHSEYKYTSVYLRVADALSRNQLLDFALWQKTKQ
jgi:site-specific recombinase XerD